MEKKIMVINLTANIFAFLVSFIISFFITPLIVKTVGKETYGFWGLANNFVNYIMVLTVAMNSLAGRFVTISIHRGEEQEAKSYFNSVMITNLTTALLLVIPGILFVANLEYFLEMPVGNYLDIKLTFAFVFAAFCVNLTSSVFSIATFATVYKGNIIKNLIMDCQSYTKYRPNETTGGIFVSWRRKEELPTGA